MRISNDRGPAARLAPAILQRSSVCSASPISPEAPIPRKCRIRPSRSQREERLRREREHDPFNGDTQALIAELDRRLLRHAQILGYEELCRR